MSTDRERAIYLAIQSLQKRGVCRNLDAIEYVRDHVDLSDYAQFTLEDTVAMVLAEAQAHSDAKGSHN